MKKKLLSAVVCGLLSFPSYAQLSVVAGPTYSSWRDNCTTYRFGFDLGAAYTLQRDSSIFCADAGVLLFNRGVNLDSGTDYTNTGEYKFRTTLYSIRIPATVGYKMKCYKDRITFVPKVGLYADFGLVGNISQDKVHTIFGDRAKYDGKDPYSELSCLENNGIKDFSRFEWGFRVGMDFFLSRRIFLQFTYDHGMNKVFDSPYYTSKFSSFSANLGYLFPKRVKKDPLMIEL